MPKRFYLALDLPDPDWREVTETEFAEAERKAGFYPTGPWTVATAGFGGRGVRGRVDYETVEEN